MFTGIVQELGKIVEIEKTSDLLRYTVEFPDTLLPDLKSGASVSIDGICQTVTTIDGNRVSFDAMEETLIKTTLDTLTIGQKVNLERSAKIGDEIGGHLLSGHIFGKTKLQKIEANIYTFACPKDWSPYFFPKGFIALDGISLTLVDILPGFFTVHLIPETLKRTTLGFKKIGEFVNVEIDSQTQIIVDTIHRRLKNDNNGT